MASITRKPVTPRAAQAPGGRGFRMLPGAARTSTGRKNPELFGASESMTDRSAKYTAERTKDRVQLIAPRTWGELPAKSNTTSLPRTSTATRIGIGSSGFTPSSSRWSTNR